MGKPYFEFEVDREEAARYGMTTMMVNQIVSAGLGGLDVTTTVEGRERYPIQIRYQRDVRERLDELRQVPVVTHTGDVVPLERLAHVATTWGPGAINSEDARLVAHVAFSPSGGAGDLETVEAVMDSLRSARESGELKFPEGNFELQAVGSFQNQIEANRRLMWIVPTVVLINLLLHYLHFRNFSLALVVFSGIPFAAAGGMIALAIMGVDMNTAIWVGFIALFGMAADDGIVMATYMQETLTRRTIRNIAGHSRRDLRRRPETDPSLHDDHRHHPGGARARAGFHRTRRGRGPRDGPARVRRHAHRTVHDLHRADAVLRLHGVQDAGRPAGRLLGRRSAR